MKHKIQLPSWGEGLIVLLTPALSYAVFEFVTGNLTSITGIYLVLNLILYYMFYLIVSAVTGSLRISYILMNTVFYLVAVAEHYVTEFRARPIMLSDVLSIKTAMTVSGTYEYEVTRELVMAGAVVLVLDILAGFLTLKAKEWKHYLTGMAGAGAVTVGFLGVFYYVVSPVYLSNVNMWSPETSYAQYGFSLCSMLLMDFFKIDKPEGYSLAAVDNLMETIEAEKPEIEFPWKTDGDTVPTNVICIMNESWSDLQAVAPFNTDIDYMEYYHSMEENTVKGNLYVSVFGALTSITEFEFLTSSSHCFFPAGTIAYQLYMKNPTYSLVSTLEAQGYASAAMHPYPAENWNRKEAYEDLGFDHFYAEEFYENSPKTRGYVNDFGDFQKIIELTQQKEPGSPLFIFNVTMQNHGGYEDESYPTTVHLTDYPGKYPKTEQYLSLIRETDQSLSGLIEYFKTVAEPTMIVMFGDHQPGIEESFYEEIYGSPLGELSSEDYLRRYMTQFFIWTNYDTPSAHVEAAAPDYLANMILQRANLQMSGYQYEVEKLHQSIPLMVGNGYYDADGTWKEWDGWTSQPEYPEFQDYQKLFYNNLLEKKANRRDYFFLPDIEQ